MLKSYFISVIIIVVLLPVAVLPQETHSFQINGGMLLVVFAFFDFWRNYFSGKFIERYIGFCSI